MMAKLSDDDVAMIMARMDAGEAASSLAPQYGVTAQYLYVLHRRSGKRQVRAAAVRDRLTIPLRSGACVVLTLDGDVLNLTEEDRTFLFRVVDLLREYEAQGKAQEG
jgi:hypothetical protein